MKELALVAEKYGLTDLEDCLKASKSDDLAQFFIRADAGRLAADPWSDTHDQPCGYIINAASRVDPPDYCDEQAVPGEDMCAEHLAYADGPDPDDAYDRLKEATLWGDA